MGKSKHVTAMQLRTALSELTSTLRQLLNRLQSLGAVGEPSRARRITVRRFARDWIAARARRDVASAKDSETRLRIHVLPSIGRMALAEVRPTDIRQLFVELRQRIGSKPTELGSRTVRHIYGDLHRLFEDAITEELLTVNPCVLRRGELPPKVDKDPAWRQQAIFTRREVSYLTSSAVTEDRRVLYAILAFAGLRFGEAAALRWRHYDPRATPLGSLTVAASFSYRTRKEKSVKTGHPRTVPVHPELAAHLARWRARGWPAMLGRAPTDEDLIIPGRMGKHRSGTRMLYRLHEDLAKIDARPRRLHDLRRTFVSLCLADGARKDILRWVSHGSTLDIVDMYTTLPWSALCAEIKKLHIPRRR
jgi:integrase